MRGSTVNSGTYRSRGGLGQISTFFRSWLGLTADTCTHVNFRHHFLTLGIWQYLFVEFFFVKVDFGPVFVFEYIFVRLSTEPIGIV